MDKKNNAMGNTTEFFPDGTVIPEWYYDTTIPSVNDLGKQYFITDYGALDDGRIHTKEIQNAIDAAAKTGGVVVVPAGVYYTGAIYFKQGVNLYLSQGATLKGSDNITDYDLNMTRMEGETCLYFGALINGDGLDGFTILGPGTIDGNGLRSWQSFWLRRKWNRMCTNKDEQRPRLVYITNSKNLLFANVTLQNSHYWTTHLYRCHHVKYLGCRILSPAGPVFAPSTDAIDLDVCSDVLVKNCYMAVNDDSVVMKGGKGPWADTMPENGSVERVIVEDCHYGFCHGCLTCGSEAIHCKNIIVRRIQVDRASNLLWLKMRPDTPQHYEYIRMEDITGEIDSFININPWTQFYDLKDRKDIPLSYADHVTMQNCNCTCRASFNVKPAADQYRLSDFVFENLEIRAQEADFAPEVIENAVVTNCNVTQIEAAPKITDIPDVPGKKLS